MIKTGSVQNSEDYLERQRIRRYFRYTCIRCKRYGDAVHEIIPRSHGKKAMEFSNRVVLCGECHTWAHNSEKVSIPILQKLREEYANIQ